MIQLIHLQSLQPQCIALPQCSISVCRVTSDHLLGGLDWLDLQPVATQLTSLSLQYNFTSAGASPCWQSNANMQAKLAQFSELRHLDIGNCQFLPTDGALCMPLLISRTSGLHCSACLG